MYGSGKSINFSLQHYDRGDWSVSHPTSFTVGKDPETHGIEGWVGCIAILDILADTVGYATTKVPTTNECYNEQFLSIKSGCYNESGGMLFVMESSIIVSTKKRLFMLFKFTYRVYKS
jgi:hypothetical protein